MKHLKFAILAAALTAWCTAAHAQAPSTTQPGIGMILSPCASNVPVVGNGSGVFTKCLTTALGAALGGTGQTSLTANAFLTGNGTSPINQVAITGLVLGNGASAPTAYAGTSCTNQFPRSLSALGVATCATVSLTTDVGGTLQAAQEPAHTGDCTNSPGSLALQCLKTNGVSFTSLATAAVGQVPGIATNTSASAGNVGEIISASVSRASAVALTTNIATNITSVSLTAGDWDCSGQVGNVFGSGTSYTILAGGASSTSATLPSSEPQYQLANSGNVPNQDIIMAVPLGQRLLSATTSIFLVAQNSFTVSTLSAYGTIRCRRMR